jgi:hypothetical protein
MTAPGHEQIVTGLEEAQLAADALAERTASLRRYSRLQRALAVGGCGSLCTKERNRVLSAQIRVPGRSGPGESCANEGRWIS